MEEFGGLESWKGVGMGFGLRD